MFLARRPSRETIDRFLLDSQDLPLSYGPVGIVRPETARQGLDEATVAIGRGETDFERARAALMAWKQFDIGWVETFPRHAPIAVGTVVAVLIRHLGFWSLNERVPNAHSGVTGCAPPVLPNRLDRLPDTPVSRRLAQSCASGVG